MDSPIRSNPENGGEKWIFRLDQLDHSPSIAMGFSKSKELSFRRQTAHLVQDMGQQLKLNQLCINTSIVYCQRFYVFHPFQLFPRHMIASAALLLAAKVEEQPRKIEHILKTAHKIRNKNGQPLDAKSEIYKDREQMLLTYESFLLQTLGFEVGVDHPHLYIVRGTAKLSASKEISQSSYFLASNVLQNTTMCLRYTPKMIACFCIFMANKAAKDKISSGSGFDEEWIKKLDGNATLDTLNEMFEEYLDIELNILDEGQGAKGIPKNIKAKAIEKRNRHQFASSEKRNEIPIVSFIDKDESLPTENCGRSFSLRTCEETSHISNQNGFGHHSSLSIKSNLADYNNEEDWNDIQLTNGTHNEGLSSLHNEQPSSMPFSGLMLRRIHPQISIVQSFQSHQNEDNLKPLNIFCEKSHESSVGRDDSSLSTPRSVSIVLDPKLAHSNNSNESLSFRPFDQKETKGVSLEQHLLSKIKHPLKYEEVVTLKENVKKNGPLEKALSRPGPNDQMSLSLRLSEDPSEEYCQGISKIKSFQKPFSEGPNNEDHLKMQNILFEIKPPSNNRSVKRQVEGLRGSIPLPKMFKGISNP